MNSCTHRWDWWPDTPEQRRLGLGIPALVYASMGYCVVPLERGAKKPHRMLPATDGVYHATTNPQVITGWWQQDPAANIGVATGRPSGLIVFDLDNKDPATPGTTELMVYLSNNMRWLPDCPHAVTPRNGKHLWLRALGGLRERPGILPGVDVKGTGGYVVAAPSMLLVQPTGLDTERSEPVPVPYEWARGCPCTLPDVPDWVPHWLDTAPVLGSTRTAGDLADKPDRDKALETGFEVGQRNRELYRLACSLYRRYGVTQSASGEVLAMVEQAWRAGDTRGMSHREVLVIIESARRWVERAQAADIAAYTSFTPWIERDGT